MSARFVIDNSIVMSWCFEDEGNSYAEAVLESLEAGEAFVPAIGPLEVDNVPACRGKEEAPQPSFGYPLSRSLRRFAYHGRTGNPRADAQGDRFLAREHRLSIYDASYLDLSMRLDLPLSKQDASLAKASKKCHVPTFDPTRPR